jgi:predicted nuclease of restriction endonuclease-like RecB superfamily
MFTMFRVPELFEWCFRDNLLNFLHIINVEFSDKAERLFEFLRIMSIIETGKNLGIENLKEKIKSEFSSWNRFKSFSSELLFANKFKENGFSVKLILDNDWTKNKIGVKAPDFMIENSNLKCLVEVVRINQDYIPGIINNR